MALLNTVDPNGLEEFSVVFTDRSLNHMSPTFQAVMTDISDMLKEVYNADAVVLVPGGGSYGMEAVARQFGQGARTLIVRNGWFSYRWTQIFDAGQFGGDTLVMKARQTGNDVFAPFAPAPIDEVTARIREEKPDIVFAPHVETSAGIILPDDYVTALATAAHEVGALMVLDCIASGCAVGRHEGDRCRCPDLGPAKRLVRHTQHRSGDAVGPCGGAYAGHHVQQLCRRSQEVASDHDGL